MERVFSSLGVKKAAHGIELAEVKSENSHGTWVLRVWGWNIVTHCVPSAVMITGQSRQILFEGSHPKPRTYMDSFVE
jgi:hypothetical protein